MLNRLFWEGLAAVVNASWAQLSSVPLVRRRSASSEAVLATYFARLSLSQLASMRRVWPVAWPRDLYPHILVQVDEVDWHLVLAE